MTHTFDGEDVRTAKSVNGVQYATVLRSGKHFRVVYEHRAPTYVVEEVESAVGLSLGSGRLGATQEHLPAADYRLEDRDSVRKEVK